MRISQSIMRSPSVRVRRMTPVSISTGLAAELRTIGLCFSLGRGLFLPEALERFTNVVMLESQDRGSEQRGVLRAVNRHASDGYAGWHLRDREEGVEAGSRVTPRRDRDADDRKGRHGGDDAGKVRGHSSGGDDHFEPIARRRGGELLDLRGRTVGGHNL